MPQAALLAAQPASCQGSRYACVVCIASAASTALAVDIAGPTTIVVGVVGSARCNTRPRGVRVVGILE